MILTTRTRCLAFSLLACHTLLGQPGANQNRDAIQLDLDGKGAEARALFQKSIDTAATPLAKAQAQRAMAMSWAFEGNCAKTAEFERKVMEYWATREAAEPANAFYQQGEMANEAARVCIDIGDLDAAEKLYRAGFEVGTREPAISDERKALWEYRWEHAQARLAARRGNKADADKHVALARNALEKMTQLKPAQQAFMPYLTGYVAFYSGDYPHALEDLLANQNDAFIQCLIAETYAKMGQPEKSREYLSKAATTKAHNPPAAYAHRMKKG